MRENNEITISHVIYVYYGLLFVKHNNKTVVEKSVEQNTTNLKFIVPFL